MAVSKYFLLLLVSFDLSLAILAFDDEDGVDLSQVENSLEEINHDEHTHHQEVPKLQSRVEDKGSLNQLQPRPTFKGDPYFVEIPEGQVPGDMGAGIKVENPTPEIQALIDEGYRLCGFNQYVADLIPLHRNLPDFRNHWWVQLIEDND